MELKYQFYIEGAPEKVWEIFMSPEQSKKIFYGCYIRSTFETGASLEYVGPGNDGEDTVHIYGEVLAFAPNHLFSYTEHPGPSYYSNHEELHARVTITLERVGNCTQLTLVNDQWSENHPSRHKADTAWWMLLSNIKTLVETGRTLDLGW
ncbi:SRPBCC domain-containing protein [Paenibacillus lutrae]|uniref:Polyketide cyclase n=1 Tax=Paenibacillus lutrae TaxID=2078573 RepID=A0A7X3K217_9BACL|nr:SRPBCC domain-containing protein [Paenibacillus lutrae]MVP02602.1 polyketide cyclase [Paenibacillus lutrae]